MLLVHLLCFRLSLLCVVDRSGFDSGLVLHLLDIDIQATVIILLNYSEFSAICFIRLLSHVNDLSDWYLQSETIII